MDLTKKYLVWVDKRVDGAYSGDELKNRGNKIKDYELRKDKPLLSRWPKAGATFVVKNGNPKNPVLPDCLLGTNRQLVISERLKNFFEQLKVSDVEYLPVNIKDQKSRTFRSKFYIAHFINQPDCLNKKASGAQMSYVIKEDIDDIKQLVFKNDPNRIVFRPAHYDQVVLIRWNAGEKLATEDFSGIGFAPLFGHPEFSKAKKNPAVQKKVDALNEMIFSSKPQSLKPLAKEKSLPRIKIPIKNLRAWVKSLTRQKLSVKNGATFQPLPGEDMWAEVYHDSPSQWPDFDPSRYYCLGSNGQSDYYLIDLENKGAVVYFTHEAGYNEHENFEKVSANLDEFKKMVRLS